MNTNISDMKDKIERDIFEELNRIHDNIEMNYESLESKLNWIFCLLEEAIDIEVQKADETFDLSNLSQILKITKAVKPGIDEAFRQTKILMDEIVDRTNHRFSKIKDGDLPERIV